MSDKASKIIVFSISQIITVIISFLFSPYLSRTLPKLEYATYNQVILIVNVCGIFFSLGLQSVVIFFYSKPLEKKSEVISTLQSLILQLGILSVCCLYLISFVAAEVYGNLLMASCIRICSLATFFYYINNYLISVLIFNSKTKYLALTSIFVSILTVFGLFVSIHSYHSIRFALVVSLVISPILSIAILFREVRTYITFEFKFYKESARSILKVSLPLYFTNLLGSTYTYYSSFFVIFAIGNIAYANYRNGAVEIPFISTIAFSVSSVILPDLNRYFHLGKLSEAFELKKKIINQCIFLLYPVIIFFIVFHHEFIVSYFSLKYAESAAVFAIYSFTCFVRINDYQDVLTAVGKSAYILRINVFYTIINIVLVCLFGIFFGIIGVAAATSVSVFCLAFMLLRKDAGIFNVRVIDFFEAKKILNIFLPSVLLAVMLKIILNNIFVNKNIIIFLLSCGVYFPVMYYFIIRRGYILESILDLVYSKLPLAKNILPNYKKQ